MNLFADLREAVAKAMNWERPRADWPVRVGNGLQVFNFDQQLAAKAEIGDMLEMSVDWKVVGHCRKIATTGWVQWEFVPLEPEPDEEVA